MADVRQQIPDEVVTSAGALKVDLTSTTSNATPVTISGAASYLPTTDVSLNGRNLKTVAGSVSAAGMTTLVSGMANRVTKVFAFSLVTSSTSAVTADVRDTNAALLWQVPEQAITGTNFGANLAVTPPGYLFKSGSGNGIALNLSAAQAINYSIAYYQDDSS